MNKVIKNASWIIGCKIVKAVLTVLITMLTARYLGPSNYGLINYAAGIVAFAAPIMRLGFDAILVHEVIKNPAEEGKTIGTAMFLNVLSGFVCIIGVTAFAAVVNSGEKDTIIVCALYSTLLVFQAVEMIQYWFQAKLLSKYTAIAMLIAYICVSLFQIVLLVKQSHIYWFALSHSLDFLIIAIILLVVYNKKAGQKLEISFVKAKKLFANGKYYMISSLIYELSLQTAKVIIKLLSGNESLGYYSAALTCASMASFVFAAIIDSMRPMVFEAQKKGKKQFEEALSTLYTVVIYFALMVSLLITVCAPVIIRVMYGEQYLQSINVLRLIAWFTAFSYIGSIRDIWIVAENKQKYIWIINLFRLLMSGMLNILLIPVLGIYGASISLVFTYFFTNVLLGFLLKPIRENNKIMLKSLDIRKIYQIAKRISINKN